MSEGARLLILDGRPRGDDRTWPLPPLLDRLEPRVSGPGALCVNRGNRARDPRVLEMPFLKKRILHPFAARWILSDSR